MNYNTLKTELAPIIRNFKKYAPVVAISILLLTQVVAAGFILTQTVSEDQYSTVEAQTYEYEELAAYGTYTSRFGEHSELMVYDSTNTRVLRKDFNFDTSFSQIMVGVSVKENVAMAYLPALGEIRAFNVSTGDRIYLQDSVSTGPDSGGYLSMAFSPDQSSYYSVGNTSGSVASIDTDTGEIEWSTDLGYGDIRGVHKSKTKENLYVSAVQSNSVSKVSPTGEILWQTTTSNSPFAGTVSPSGDVLYQATASGIDVIDTDTGEITDTYSLSGEPKDVTYNPNSQNYYVAADSGFGTSTSGYLSVWDPESGNLGTEIDANGWGEAHSTETSIYGHQSLSNARRYEIGGSITTLATFEHTSTYASYDNPLPAGPVTDPELDIETRNYIKHGNAAAYEIYYTDPDTGETTIVNNESGLSLNSSNTSVFTVDTANEQLVATGDTSINQREQFTAEYEGLQTQENITVANQTVENLPILPGITRVGATYSDTNIALILVGTLLGVVATWVSSAFAGIGALQLTLVAGWFVDLVSLGVVLVGLFAALFIGLNLAANIDYAVSR
jgi:hypothetical protein